MFSQIYTGQAITIVFLNSKMMKWVYLSIFVLVSFICYENVTANFNVEMIKPKIDPREVKCLVCQTAIEEITYARSKLNPARKIEVGSYRLDNKGNYNNKLVPESDSEVKLSEIMDEVCERFDDYAKATWKSNDKLTIISMMDRNGGMNPDISNVNLIQDDDLNKSLKYYCQNIVEEYEDQIIQHLIKGTENVEDAICSKESQLCASSFEETDEYYSPNENDEL